MTDVLHLRGDRRDLLGTEIVAVRYDPDRDTTDITCDEQPAVQPARGLAPIPYVVTEAGLAALAAWPANRVEHDPHFNAHGGGCDGRGCRCNRRWTR